MKLEAASFALLALLAGAPARADVVHLTNGRFIEGKVVEERQGSVYLEVPGGRLVVPASSIERIERRDTPTEEYARRARELDTSDPDAVERLGLWASVHGLGAQSQQLEALAVGLRLERRVAAARRAGGVQGWIDLFHWARAKTLSREVLVWLLAQAQALDPADPNVVAAARALEAEDTTCLPDAPPAALAPAGCAPADEDERVARLEQELARGRSEQERLREELDAERRRARRRHRNPNPVVLPRDLARPTPPPPAPPTIVAPSAR